MRAACVIGAVLVAGCAAPQSTGPSPSSPQDPPDTVIADAGPRGDGAAASPAASVGVGVSQAVAHGAIIGPDRATLYAMTPGGVAAFEIATGQQVWIAPDFVKPLVAVDGRLVVAGIGPSGAPGIAVVDADTGARPTRCETPGAGGGEQVQLFDGLGSRVASAGYVVDGQAVIVWSRNTFYSGGMAPTPEMERAARTHSEGALAVDLATGCTTPTEAPSALAVPPIALYGDERTAGPFTAGDIEASLELRPAGNERTVVLQRSRGGQALREVELATATPGYFYAQVSVDGRHALVAVQRTAEHNLIVYDWRLAELATGAVQEIAGRGYSPGAFAVVGDVIVSGGGFVEGAARDGTQLWTVGLRSTTYNGPYPP